MRKTEPEYATSSDCMEIECLRVPSPELKISLYSSVNDPELLSAPRIPCDGQSRMMASRTVTSWASLNTQDSVPPLTSKPSKTTWLDCWNLMVRSEEHTSELQSLMSISYAVFCLKKKKKVN